MSLPAPSRVSKRRQPSLQHHEQARSPRARKPQQAQRAALPTAAIPPPPRGGSQPQAAHGRSADRSHREALQAARARTPAGALSRSRHRSPVPALHAATACSRHIAPATAPTRALARSGAPHSNAQDPPAAAPTTSRPRQCGAKAKAVRARASESSNRCARNGGSALRSKPSPAARPSAPASAASLTAETTSRARTALAARIS